VNPLLEPLTPAQRQAVQHIDGPLLILAGPGSGKTRVVTHRVAYMLESGVGPSQILALTFTNKAADEMRGRVNALAPGKRVWVSTFHRFCARLLREYAPLVGLRENYTIYDTGDSQQALKRAIEELHVDATHYTPQQIAASISWAKNNLITAGAYQSRAGHPLGSVVAKVYPAYQTRLLNSSAVDFDDLLLHIAGLLRENPEVRRALDERFRYILVDEYQDTNLAQYTIVRALSLDQPNLAVTGDPDQSIYGWRGANLSNILEFEADYPQVRVVRLEQNYRSTKRILRVAAHLIEHNLRRKQKGLFTDNDEGRPVRLVTYFDQKTESDAIAARIADDVRAGRRRPRDFAVFYRVNALSRAVETAMREHGVPYQIVNGVEFYQRKEIKDVLAYLTLLNNPRDDVAFQRIVNTPARGIGKTTLDRIRRHATHKGQTLLEAARESGLVESLAKKTAVVVARFVAMFDRLSLFAARPVEEILGNVLNETGYREMLADSESVDDQERLANVEELLTAAREFDARHPGEGHLEEFLEESCLVNDTDAWEAADDRVTLMTLHASKGLEFPAVFLIALEQGLIPHERSARSADELEEERRLLFVGITRAQQELHLSRAHRRVFRGREIMTVPSQFIFEMPRDEMDCGEIAAATTGWEPPSRGEDTEGPDAQWRHDARLDSDASDDANDGASVNEFAFGANLRAAGEGDDRGQPPLSERTRSAAQSATASPPSIAPLTTAAELATAAPLASAARPDLPAVRPEVFYQGMLVRHPAYGLGKVVALSGSDAHRKATVAFASTAGQKSFVLQRSALRPAKPGS
jgi:ATP-dependent DNA helicase UvrD/PcrA